MRWWWLAALTACESPEGKSGTEVEVCDNLADDDEDGDVDCQDADCAASCGEVCADGLDNDLDGLADCADPECDGSCPEVCDDTRDNDGDGSIDCADRDCVGSCPEVCDDGADNDGDGLVDCLDDDCVLPSCPETCGDGRDNDGDGLADCEDEDCDGRCPEVCDDGRDNDRNGQIDCDDAACDGSCAEDCADGRDNDGDGQVDCDDPECQVACDQDEDGFANRDFGGDDCDDTRADINPSRTEVCDRLDNDCDDAIDEDDPSLDLLTLGAFYPDGDGDGYGFGRDAELACFPGPGQGEGNRDCDDADPAINPAATEVCDGVDNDCDRLLDEDDDTLDESTRALWFLDADGDGYGSTTGGFEACTPPDGYVANDDDCDDDDPLLGPPTLWYPDLDRDGYAPDDAEPVDLVPSCEPPVPGSAPVLGDCDDSDPTFSPGVVEPCEDGLDQDCDGADDLCVRPSCKAWLEADPSSASGVYRLQPDPALPEVEAWCDMETDGGGWTLVASTRRDPLQDQGSAWYEDLTTLSPADPHRGIWGDLRSVIVDRSDIRFACKSRVESPTMNVDLSFYDTRWFREITAASDGGSCFQEADGSGEDSPPPERRNNLTGATRPLGDRYGAGYHEGEDSCGDPDDFTIDFDDRGMDSNESDGTDWGEDDGRKKCGTAGSGEAWFIFVREP